MFIIAENLGVRNRDFMRAVEGGNRSEIARMAGELKRAGADAINVQCSLDGSGDEDRMPWVAEAIEKAVDSLLCLDTRNSGALKKCFSVLKKSCIINYLSSSEPRDSEELLRMVQKTKSHLVLRASGESVPLSFEARLQILEDLLEAANRADIPNERLFMDPSVVHMGRGMGQEHLVNAIEVLHSIREMIDPRVNTVAWISNISTGMKREMRKVIEAAFLLYMAGAGLDAAVVDVLDPELKKAIYLVKSFRDDVVFSPADMLVHAEA
jgi:cobalamin-dependent methionine synthase I